MARRSGRNWGSTPYDSRLQRDLVAFEPRRKPLSISGWNEAAGSHTHFTPAQASNILSERLTNWGRVVQFRGDSR